MENTLKKIQEEKKVFIVVTAGDLREFAQQIANEMRESQPRAEVPQEEPLYTPDDFAHLMGVNKSTLWRWRKAGLLKEIRMGGRIFYQKSDLKFRKGGKL